MLILSRNVGEEIVIGDKIHITVMAIKGDQVCIGISAPKGVVVDRQEVHEKRKNAVSEGAAFPPTPTNVIDTTPL